MPSAPVITITAGGVAQWVNPAVPPLVWNLEICFDDATTPNTIAASTQVPGTNTSFDAFTNLFPGNFRVKLYGTDANANLLFSPTLSTNYTRLQ